MISLSARVADTRDQKRVDNRGNSQPLGKESKNMNTHTAAGPCLRFNMEGAVLLDGRFLLVDAADVGPARAAVQQAGELRELVLGTYRIHFDAAIIQIAREAGQAQLVGGTLCEIAVPHALHAATHQEPARMMQLVSHPEGEDITR